MCIGIEGSDLLSEDCSGNYAHRILVVNSEENRPLGRPRYWRKNNSTKQIKTRMKGRILVSSGSGQEQVTGPCEHSNEFTGPIKCARFIG
jgi:hypothetical protein